MLDEYRTETALTGFDVVVVLALGYKPDCSLECSLRKAGFRVIPFGDGVKPGKVMQAVQQGMYAAYTL